MRAAPASRHKSRRSKSSVESLFAMFGREHSPARSHRTTFGSGEMFALSRDQTADAPPLKVQVHIHRINCRGIANRVREAGAKD
jgi:hypothetical protein